ncbi:glucoamylase family protein [Oryzobacter telluris]|uniref:glucoamylase family protein n=1 Tax=Oryzobacter telluris TaxID=3149179 RepID=UPI00370D873A
MTDLILPTPGRRQLILGGAAALAGLGFAPTTAVARPASAPLAGTAAGVPNSRLHRWAADTWHSLDAMTAPATGLPADNIPESLAAGDRSGYTSPTNIGGYLWSTVVARELGIISRAEASRRMLRTVQTLEGMEHHEPSGMFYNWYDEETGDAIRVWPTSGDPVEPFVSSVDSGWLGAALLVVANADPVAGPRAKALFDKMRWDAFYNPGDGKDGHPVVRTGGLMHGGFFPYRDGRPGGTYQGTHIGGEKVWLTTHHYDTIVSETRITSYLGILTGQVPGRHYYAAYRTFPRGDCNNWNWQEMQPVGQTRTYLGVEVFEGAYTYRGMHIVPGWGGSMFEELMPAVFVPEETWAPNSWGVNHPLHVRAEREHGMEEAGYGYWGFSPASDPFDNYREYGVDALGMNPEGYFSDKEKTNYDAGFGDCRPGSNPNPKFGDGVVTPHASFLAMMFERGPATANLLKIEQKLGAYGKGGFFDAVAVKSGTIARRYLSLDQAMVMGALGNVLSKNVLRRAFSTPEVEAKLRPVIGIERFGAGIIE